MVPEANNDGKNIKGLFAVVLQGVSSLWVGCFYKVVDHRVSSCFQVLPLCLRFPEDILLFINGSTFSGYFLLLFIIMFILWSTSVQFMCAVFYYFGTIYVDLLFAILSIYLRYIILLLLILKIFSPQGLNLLFQINCKNISCNGFQRNVNARN